ncbi:unnamed protein product [Rotaria sordida]|uniref:Uncharacterized protein n=1 Tax=Rotaria sordida TaxID=392033 RepID=A0A818LS15_9BILA|nr:unnamed protein product [Rotaria sordida]
MIYTFKSNYNVELYLFPPPQFQYGSFAYDTQFNLDKQPKCDLHFECLHITQSVAEEIFSYNRFSDYHLDITHESLILSTKQ